MLDTLKRLKGAMILSANGENVGEIKDFYFDDEHWTLRYLEVNTGSWPSGKRVLISPYHIQKIEWGGFRIQTNLSKEDIESSPSPEEEKPISRLYEEKYSNHYLLPYYWTAGDGIWPNHVSPSIYAHQTFLREEMERKLEKEKVSDRQLEQSHLRSYNEVKGYKIHAKDDVFGHLEDMVMQEEDYQLKFLIIDTINFFPSKSVIIATKWISNINWNDREIQIELSKDEIKSSLEYDPMKPIDEHHQLHG